MKENQKNHLILLFIIFSGALLRFYRFTEIPFTHDEFSALFRLYFQNFSDLIEHGVKVDGHPAGIQVFLYYWTKLLGFSETVVKFPFLMFGVLSIGIIYLIGKEWFNQTVGLISAAFLASLQYTIMNSQIARPYISGLFFSLLMVWFWSKLVFKPKKKDALNISMYITSSALCAYNHHFSLLFAAIVGFSGLFFVKRIYLKKYVLSGLLIFILYIPHLKIFFYQLNAGGIENWLSKPSYDFIIVYIAFIFQYSYVSIILIALLIAISLIDSKKIVMKHQFIILSFIWFFLPFAVGFTYSTLVNSVLQVNVLIFSFPFLFFILFGHLRELKPKINFILVLLIVLSNTLVLKFERKHHQLFLDSPYLGILEDHQNAHEQHKKTISIIDSNRKISAYYISRGNFDTSFTWLDTFENEKSLISYLEEKSISSDYLYFGCLSGSNPVIVPLIMDYFPQMIWQKDYAGATSYLFSKKIASRKNTIKKTDFGQLKTPPINKNNNIQKESTPSGIAFLLDSLTEFSNEIILPLDSIITHRNNFIDISVNVFKPDSMSRAVLVASIHNRKKQLHWNGSAFDQFTRTGTDKKSWITIHHSVKLLDIKFRKKNSVLKVYLWNRGHENLIIDKPKIKLRQGNPIIYGLFEKF